MKTPSILRRGRVRTRASAMRGATLVEMAVSLLIFLTVIFAIAEVMLMFKAKAVVDMAAMAAARAGATDNARNGAGSQMQLAGRTALAPLYMRRGAGNGDVLTAAVRANADGLLGMSIEVLNPTAASFRDHGVTPSNGGSRYIPNDSLMYRSTQVKANSRQNIQDANILKVRMTHCYNPKMPLSEEFLSIARLILWNGLDRCLAMGRIAIRSEAMVRMQSPAYQ